MEVNKMIIIIMVGVGLLGLGWFVGINSIYTDTYGYPPLGKPFIQQDDGAYIQSIERMETKTYIGIPFAKNRNRSYFMLFEAFPDNTGGKYIFPGGEYIISDTVWQTDGVLPEGLGIQEAILNLPKLP